ncbi:beta-N-acetylhexosaminidase [Pseudopedobacter beijingensis]|uniref:beta-N-acetylhexosaminidase n=1 Tax=Pseudopedobacter beijingensis TaxID=1207056 RepID=A0ABW4I7T4_9SPHI
MRKLIITTLLLNFFLISYETFATDIIPKPLYAKNTSGFFSINEKTIIYISNEPKDFENIAIQLSDEIFKIKGFKPNIKIYDGKNLKKNHILLEKDQKADTLGGEGYGLKVKPEGVVISASQAHGVFYGVQSLVQLIRNSSEGKILGVEIYDKPRFAWRGMMLDVGRYFYSTEFIKKLIDNLAVYKINTFHWHLTEDQGWRIEIKKYPELVKKAAWRSETLFGIGLDKNWIDKNPHGGYYTQEEIKDVVRYAQSKFIAIVPEIEMPGHSSAVLAAMPQLSCIGGPFQVPGKFGVLKEVYCAGNEETFRFLEDVLTEVAELFPGSIIHIGGDECPKDRWKVCPKCQERIKKEGLKDEHELQSYFIKRIEQFLLTKNKNIIGWDEILEGGLAPNAMVMSWRGTKGGIAAAKMKHDVVMSPNTHLYFDYYQGEPDLEQPYGRVRALPLPIQKVYDYEPIPLELDKEEAKYVKGLQANVWTELLHTQEAVEYMIFPRITAVAEVGWTSASSKNWSDFARRLENEWSFYEKEDVNYARTIDNVWFSSSIDTLNSKATVTLTSYRHGTEIRYTLDGTHPTYDNSILYTKPFVVDMPLSVKAAIFISKKRVGKVVRRTIAVVK